MPRKNIICDATKIDEYVPIKTPIIIAKVNPLITSPPRKYKENNAKRVVTEVSVVLDNVSLMELLISSNKSICLYFLRFSLMRSYTTTVSFIE